MNVLSLFDGCSGGRLSLVRANDLRLEYDQSLPLKYAEQVRIYIDHK